MVLAWRACWRPLAATLPHAVLMAQARAHAASTANEAAEPSGQRAAVPGDGAATADAASAFDTLFARCERQVFGCLWRLTGDSALASDLCQETFLRAWQHFAQVSTHDEPLAWLLRVATNLALNVRRRHHTRVGIPLPLNERNAPAHGDPASQVPERDLVHQTLLALPPTMRATLVLREVYGLSFEEIAQALGSTPAATRMTLSRARERFRQRYRREEERA